MGFKCGKLGRVHDFEVRFVVKFRGAFRCETHNIIFFKCLVIQLIFWNSEGFSSVFLGTTACRARTGPGKPVKSWPRLFDDRLTLSTRLIFIRWITLYVLLSLIRWIAIYQLDSVISLYTTGPWNFNLTFYRTGKSWEKTTGPGKSRKSA